MRSIVKLLFGVFYFLPYQVSANIARSPLSRDGNVIVSSPMRGITVLHEDLTFEFLSINNSSEGDIKVTAIYKIMCPGFVDSLDLIFIANDLYSNRYSVMLDGNSIAGQTKEVRNIPKSWLPPDSIQGNHEMIFYQYTSDGIISFRLDGLTSGKHILSVAFLAKSAAYYSDANNYKSLVYILKPDSGWKDFDTLDLHVKIPDNSLFTSNLKLEKKSSNVLHALWPKLPSTYFSIALYNFIGVPKVVSKITIFLSLAILMFICCYWLYLLAKHRIRNKSSKAPQIISCIIISVLNITIFPFIIFAINTNICLSVYGDEITPYSEIGRGYIYLMVFGFPLLIIISLLITFGINSLIIVYAKSKISNSL